MTENVILMGFVVWVIGLVATALGTILGYFLEKSGLIGIAEIEIAIIWFLISFVTYFAGTKLKEEKWFKVVSVNFILTWAFCTIGYLLGLVVSLLIDGSSVTLDGDFLVNQFFFSLPLTIGPTATISLGLRD